MSEIDQDTVDFLRKSKEIVGPLRPCIRSQNGKLLAGKHRKEADPDWPEVVKKVSDELDEELVRMHDNIQRKVSQEETKESLLRIAELLVAKGVNPKEVAKEMVKIVPYHYTTVYNLLPSDYKIIQLRVNDRTIEHIHEDVKNQGIVVASQMLAKRITEAIPEVPKDDPPKVLVKTTEKPKLPFLDCRCAGCNNYEKCRLV